MDKKIVDVRNMSPQRRHGYIFDSFHSLKPGQVMELINDHDPKPLWFQFSAEMSGQFEWAYIEQGPDDWRVDIKKLNIPDINAENTNYNRNDDDDTHLIH